jgi:cyclopropane fatty-acyl-phospholipid synthase-like methyltransferase
MIGCGQGLTSDRKIARELLAAEVVGIDLSKLHQVFWK